MNTLFHSITQYDLAAYTWCMERRHSRILARIARPISRIGDGPFYFVFGLFVLLVDQTSGLKFFLCVLSAYAIEVPVYLLLKNLIKRDRPFIRKGTQAFITPSDKFSFPSGHTAAAFVMAISTSLVYPEWWLLSVTLSVSIGLSRVLLGVHYFTDIIAGAVLGSSIALLTHVIYF